MKITTKEDCKNFVERFNFFYDSVIRKASLESDENAYLELSVEISVRDLHTSRFGQNISEVQWCNIQIVMREIMEIKFIENYKQPHKVISNGLHIIQNAEGFLIDFGDCIEDELEESDIRNSDFYVFSKKVIWKII